MGTWTITLNDETEAMQDAPTFEIGRALVDLAAQFLNDGGPDCEYLSMVLHDSRGQRCGLVSYLENEETEQ